MRYSPRADCQIPVLADLYEAHLPEGNGRFVEVGAFDGATVSNTVFLTEAGWQGLYIEPHPAHAELCRMNHLDHLSVTVVEKAVSNQAGLADLYEIGECSTLVWDKSAIDWGGKQERKVQVETCTLDTILQELAWTPGFELLVIDVEQNELKVLWGFDIDRWKPRMVIIEAHEKDNEPARNCKAPPINEYFQVHGYAKVYSDHINSIFLRSC